MKRLKGLDLTGRQTDKQTNRQKASWLHVIRLVELAKEEGRRRSSSNPFLIDFSWSLSAAVRYVPTVKTDRASRRIKTAIGGLAKVCTLTKRNQIRLGPLMEEKSHKSISKTQEIQEEQKIFPNCPKASINMCPYHFQLVTVFFLIQKWPSTRKKCKCRHFEAQLC